MHEAHADVIIIGGGTGGCAAALAACRRGQTVIMSEPTSWIGGQFTSQGVPPDEHKWIEYFGATDAYRDLRHRIRDFYLRNFPLTAEARRQPRLNLGMGECSSINGEPRAFLAAIHELLAPYVHSGRLLILQPFAPISAEVDADSISSVRIRHLTDGSEINLQGSMFIDATELGDLLPLAGVEHVTGAESQAEHDEPHALPEANPRLMEGITWCFAMDHIPGEDHTIARPSSYEYFRDTTAPGWPGSQLSYSSLDYETYGAYQHTFLPVKEDGPIWESLWSHRRMIDRRHFANGLYASDITLVNWTQNDYVWGPIIGVPADEAAHHLEMSRQLSLSLLYWLQTEAPREDGGQGFPGLRARGDVMGTTDGLAMAPYIRESRRIKARVTIREQDISAEVNDVPRPVSDSVGVGYYYIDMHQRTEGGMPFYVYVWPFQIPLGALVPIRLRNLVPAAKNLGTTHLTNAAYRMHSVEWCIGEAAGHFAAYCVSHDLLPHAVIDDQRRVEELQRELLAAGVEINWPRIEPDRKWDDHLAYTVHPTAELDGPPPQRGAS